MKDNIKHGYCRKHNRHPLYYTWVSMKNRCNRSDANMYKYYGGRGIKVCKSWNNSFVCFMNWAVKNGYKEGLQIDRINNNKNYCPSNCQWLTAAENSRKKSTTKLTLEQVKTIRYLHTYTNVTALELSKKFNVSDRHIGRILHHDVWK